MTEHRATPTAERAAIVHDAATRLQRATATGIPCGPVRDLLGSTDIALAYDVQSVLTRARVDAGARIVGRKIGLTSPAVQKQIGVDRPDFGVLFDDMLVAEDHDVPSERLLQPKAEAEIAFVLAADLDSADLDHDDLAVAAVRAAVDYAVAALEIVDSRVQGWDIAITDTVADNASSGMYVLGAERVALADFAPVEVTMSLSKDGTVVSTGNGAACLGDPLNALVWLARTAREFGSPLRAGDVVLSGALGAMVAVEPGSQVTAELSTLGRVSATFSTKEIS
jgi:2-keto-4-pentenoate hydratase